MVILTLGDYSHKQISLICGLLYKKRLKKIKGRQNLDLNVSIRARRPLNVFWLLSVCLKLMPSIEMVFGDLSSNNGLPFN